MTLAELQRIRSIGAGSTDGALPTPQVRRPGSTSFSETLQQAVGQVDHAQKAADTQVEAFVAGEQENVHEVMLAMNEAKLSFQLMTEVRNRMLETYQELMRMQV